MKRSEPEHDLVAVELAGALEAIALVERDRAALALTGARRQRTGASRSERLDEQVERRRTDASSLVPRVDEIF